MAKNYTVFPSIYLALGSHHLNRLKYFLEIANIFKLQEYIKCVTYLRTYSRGFVELNK